MKKILLISSSGGHFQQLNQIKNNIKDNELNNIITISEYVFKENREDEVFYFPQFNRKSIYSQIKFIFSLISICRIILKFRPDVIISTGAGFVLVPMFISKLLGIKTIFFESFAKVESKTLTGRICYLFVDRFYVQWEEMLKIYPKAIYKGGLY